MFVHLWAGVPKCLKTILFALLQAQSAFILRIMSLNEKLLQAAQKRHQHFCYNTQKGQSSH